MYPLVSKTNPRKMKLINIVQEIKYLKLSAHELFALKKFLTTEYQSKSPGFRRGSLARL
jgi:hypothetical protein